LQESLTNMHRHSGSSTVDIRLNIDAKRVILDVRDYGCGMPRELLQHFQDVGTGGGVGLAGMQERISELGGRLEISAADPGTVVTVSMPVSICEDTLASFARAEESRRSVPAASVITLRNPASYRRQGTSAAADRQPESFSG